MLPYQNIPCSNSVTLQQCSLTSSCTLAVSYEDGDILTMLGQDQVCVLHVLLGRALASPTIGGQQ